jgi:Uma2 family endonuclease
MIAVTINFNSIVKLTDDQFYQLCRENPDVKFERNAKGEIIIMPPTEEKPEVITQKLMRIL